MNLNKAPPISSWPATPLFWAVTDTSSQPERNSSVKNQVHVFESNFDDYNRTWSDTVGQLSVPLAQLAHGVVHVWSWIPSVLTPKAGHPALGSQLKVAKPDDWIRTLFHLGRYKLFDTFAIEAFDVARAALGVSRLGRRGFAKHHHHRQDEEMHHVN